MLQIIQMIGYGMVIFLCLFALMVFYFCFRGGVEKGLGLSKNDALIIKEKGRSIGGRILDRTAWGINGLACLWIALRHRHRLWRLVELSVAGEFDHNTTRFTDTGQVITLLEGMVVVSHLFGDEGVGMDSTNVGKTLYVRRPFEFLERDWMESMGFRRDDGRVT